MLVIMRCLSNYYATHTLKFVQKSIILKVLKPLKLSSDAHMFYCLQHIYCISCVYH